MTIKKTFLPPEYWYVKKDTSHIHWITFEKWFREKGKIRGDYNSFYDYFTYDFDGYTILPNPPKKTAKHITIEQWMHWYSLQDTIRKGGEIYDKILSKRFKENISAVYIKTNKPEKTLSQKRAEAIERGKEVKVEITEDEHWQYAN